ncbi:MAG TPA: outer membrane protein assembly factor BamD [Anaeromyxobacteraceae bacterium]|jgi:outer membrane protein assembly factor BamD|nr:outer membrane protein assembly factor BamD [Anaeromyxobacteraceae bacterium]
MRRLLPFALLLAAACGSSRVSLSGEVRYGKSAEEDYTAGLAEMKDHNWPEAVKFFEHARTKYPFSKFAALSELGVADVKYEQDAFVEAAEAYDSFVKLHPTHEKVDYAAFRAGESLYKEAPTGFVLFPPAYEKDQAELVKAAQRFTDFLKAWPSSKYRPEVEKLLAAARDRLAEHEWYVAQFYAKREKWAGAAGRLEGLVRDYPGSGREVEALLQLTDLYASRLDDRFRARQALQQLITRQPEAARKAGAEKRLEALR